MGKNKYEAPIKKEEAINKLNAIVLEIEEKSFITNVNGWRMRVYFNSKKDLKKGQTIEVEYTGNIEDIHSIKLLPLK